MRRVKLKHYFFTGLAILLPLAVTIAILGILIRLLTEPFTGIFVYLLGHLPAMKNGFLFLTPEQTIHYGSQLLALIFLFFLTILLGVIARWFFFTALLNFSDRILHRIPIVNTVYKTTQDIIKTLFAPDKKTFKQVVMAPFPHTGAYVLGLVSREAPVECSQKMQEELITVLVPSTPNPTTGFLLLYKKEDLIFLDMKAEDAIKFTISCGVINPKLEEAPT